MELPELKEGLENISSSAWAPPEGFEGFSKEDYDAYEAAPKVSFDEMMGTYGPAFSNNKELGQELFNNLQRHHVDTTAAMQGALYGMLKDLADSSQQLLNAIQLNNIKAEQMQAQVAQDNINMMSQANATQQKVNAMADAVAETMSSSNPDAAAAMLNGGNNMAMPAQGEAAPPDTAPAAAGAADMPAQPSAAPAPEAQDVPAQDVPAQDVPAQGEAAPPDTAPAAPAVPDMPAQGVPSDRGIKKVWTGRFTISDESLKNIVGRIKQRHAPKISSSILSACKGGF